METPLISAIIPAYNAEKYIADAIDSILNQEYPNMEVIVVDDGSTDNTSQVLQRYKDRITILSQANQGQSVARNVGIQHARGSIVGFLDADDVWTPDHIALLLLYLVGENSYDVARGYTQCVKYLHTDDEERQEPEWRPVSFGAGLFKRSIFDSVGFLDVSMRQGQDFDWAVRAKECGCREKMITGTTQLYRRHLTNQTNDFARLKKGYTDTIFKKLARAKIK